MLFGNDISKVAEQSTQREFLAIGTYPTLTLGNLLSPLPNLCSHPIKLHAINEFIELSPPSAHTHTPIHKEIGKN